MMPKKNVKSFVNTLILKNNEYIFIVKISHKDEKITNKKTYKTFSLIEPKKYKSIITKYVNIDIPKLS